MSSEETVDKLVDRAIEEALARADKEDEDILVRKPKPFRLVTQKPFRYLTDPEEIKAELSSDKITATVMEKSPAAKIFEEKVAILGLGDLDTIENVIKKHEASRKFSKK